MPTVPLVVGNLGNLGKGKLVDYADKITYEIDSYLTIFFGKDAMLEFNTTSTQAAFTKLDGKFSSPPIMFQRRNKTLRFDCSQCPSLFFYLSVD